MLWSVVLFLAAAGLSYLYFPSVNQNASSGQGITATRLYEQEIALIYLGCSECPASQDEQLPSLVKKLAGRLKDKSAEYNYGFTLIGISNELDIQNGIDHLFKIAEFDEISLGNTMSNTALQRYVWENFEGPLSGATPQIIISERIYDTEEDSNNETIYHNIKSEKILIRRVGVRRIGQLLNNTRFLDELL